MSDFINTADRLGDEAVADGLICRTVEEYFDDSVAAVGAYAFAQCAALASVSLPLAGEAGGSAFSQCSALTEVELPALTTLGNQVFYQCTALEEISLPALTALPTSTFNGCAALKSVELPLAASAGSYAFSGCSALERLTLPALETVGDRCFQNCKALPVVDLPVGKSLAARAFYQCYSLTALVLRGDSLCTLAADTALTGCYHFLGTTNSAYNPTGAKDGYIYVPAALMESYQTAANWSTYADRFRALEDYTVDGTTTGALDESKL